MYTHKPLYTGCKLWLVTDGTERYVLTTDQVCELLRAPRLVWNRASIYKMFRVKLAGHGLAAQCIITNLKLVK